jgi:hypothetical protein
MNNMLLEFSSCLKKKKANSSHFYQKKQASYRYLPPSGQGTASKVSVFEIKAHLRKRRKLKNLQCSL